MGQNPRPQRGCNAARRKSFGRPCGAYPAYRGGDPRAARGLPWAILDGSLRERRRRTHFQNVVSLKFIEEQPRIPIRLRSGQAFGSPSLGTQKTLGNPFAPLEVIREIRSPLRGLSGLWGRRSQGGARLALGYSRRLPPGATVPGGFSECGESDVHRRTTADSRSPPLRAGFRLTTPRN
jgi:hypothetical protein